MVGLGLLGHASQCVLVPEKIALGSWHQGQTLTRLDSEQGLEVSVCNEFGNHLEVLFFSNIGDRGIISEGWKQI